MKCKLVAFYFRLLYILGIFHILKLLFNNKNYMMILNFLNRCSKKGEGRRYLEYEIIPNYNPKNGVMLIGSMHYNIHYSYYYLHNKVYIIEPNLEQYYTKGRAIFINKNIQDISIFDEQISLCIFNGVYGWGINDSYSLKDAIEKIYNILIFDGLLILGHNVKDHNPISLENRYDIFFNKFKEIKNNIVPYIKNNQVYRIYKK